MLVTSIKALKAAFAGLSVIVLVGGCSIFEAPRAEGPKRMPPQVAVVESRIPTVRDTARGIVLSGAMYFPSGTVDKMALKRKGIAEFAATASLHDAKFVRGTKIFWPLEPVGAVTMWEVPGLESGRWFDKGRDSAIAGIQNSYGALYARAADGRWVRFQPVTVSTLHGFYVLTSNTRRTDGLHKEVLPKYFGSPKEIYNDYGRYQLFRTRKGSSQSVYWRAQGWPSKQVVELMPFKRYSRSLPGYNWGTKKFKTHRAPFFEAMRKTGFSALSFRAPETWPVDVHKPLPQTVTLAPDGLSAFINGPQSPEGSVTLELFVRLGNDLLPRVGKRLRVAGYPARDVAPSAYGGDVTAIADGLYLSVTGVPAGGPAEDKKLGKKYHYVYEEVLRSIKLEKIQ